MIGHIKKITFEAEEIMGFTIRLSEPFVFIPGKYVMLSFPESPDIKKAFSVVNYNKKKNQIFLVIKKNGEFTSKLFSSRVGQKMNVFGPYGRFILPQHIDKKPLVFVAGGIGITPLYSIINHIYLSSSENEAYLYYTAKSEKKAAFLANLKEINDERIKIRLRFTESGDKRITPEEIKKEFSGFNESMFFICGPGPMIDSFRQGLMHLNISEEMIKSEEFS